MKTCFAILLLALATTACTTRSNARLREQNAFLKAHNVKFAIEAHPGFIVYNPETVIKLRNAAGENIGECDCATYCAGHVQPSSAKQAATSTAPAAHADTSAFQRFCASSRMGSPYDK